MRRYLFLILCLLLLLTACSENLKTNELDEKPVVKSIESTEPPVEKTVNLTTTNQTVTRLDTILNQN